MVEIAVEIDDAAVRRGLRELIDAGGERLSEAMAEVAGFLRESAEESFRQGSPRAGPDGAAWPPLAESTRVEKARKGLPERPLIRGGALATILSDWSRPGEEAYAAAGSPLEYAAAHHFGSLPGTGQNIPARPFLGLRDETAEDILAAISRRIQAAWSG